MIVIFICLPLLLAGLCRYFKKHIAEWTLLFVSGLLLLTSAGGLIPSLLMSSLQQPYLKDPVYHWAQNSAIILLGGGSEIVPDAASPEPEIFSLGRIEKAVELYLDCKKGGARCVIIVSGGDPQGHGITEAQTYQLSLEKSGVALADIELEDKSRNTFQNAQFIAAKLKLEKFSDRPVLVTSGYHLRRSLLYFSHFGLEVLPVRADYVAPKFRWTAASYNLLLTDVALHEYIGTWRYRFYNLMGWNTPAS